MIKKFGGSYYLILPKNQVEFFGWNNHVVYIERINSDEIVVRKFLNVKIEPKVK